MSLLSRLLFIGVMLTGCDAYHGDSSNLASMKTSAYEIKNNVLMELCGSNELYPYEYHNFLASVINSCPEIKSGKTEIVFWTFSSYQGIVFEHTLKSLESYVSESKKIVTDSNLKYSIMQIESFDAAELMLLKDDELGLEIYFNNSRVFIFYDRPTSDSSQKLSN